MDLRNRKRGAVARTDTILALVLALLLWPCISTAGSFGVTPIRLDFDRNTKTGVLKISNDVDEPLQVQMKAFTWTQDAEGKDHYEESSEIIFFPKIMTLDKQEHKLLRAGIQLPALQTEKTYRLFIEEMPPVSSGTAQGTQVAVRIRFGVPLFVKPLTATPQGTIAHLELHASTLSILVQNTGNEHFIINTIRLQSGDLFSTELQGWYLLAGASRTYQAPIPPEVCRRLSTLDVTIQTDKLDLHRQAAVTPSMCQP